MAEYKSQISASSRSRFPLGYVKFPWHRPFGPLAGDKLQLLLYDSTRRSSLPPASMQADLLEDKPNYKLCLCSVHDCKGQVWLGKDGQMRNGKWYHKRTQGKHYTKEIQWWKDNALNWTSSSWRTSSRLGGNTPPRIMLSVLCHLSLSATLLSFQRSPGKCRSSTTMPTGSIITPRMPARNLVCNSFSPAFLSGHGNDALTVKALTEKYGLEVFANYDLAYVTKKATSGNSQANSDDSGESVGSRDSTDESDGESVGSFISDEEEAMAEDAQEFRSERCNPPAFAASYDTDLEAQIFGGDSDLKESSV
ncbi:hypothetical protein B0H10DRAFT_2195485 [Mycena sp. CBHHK59/15]|nr:hypothetical protein B0H10DRAFT_2195485 [Mycena sp. CBHHK59/15]